MLSDPHSSYLSSLGEHQVTASTTTESSEDHTINNCPKITKSTY